jgi:hypothetical protein
LRSCWAWWGEPPEEVEPPAELAALDAPGEAVALDAGLDAAGAEPPPSVERIWPSVCGRLIPGEGLPPPPEEAEPELELFWLAADEPLDACGVALRGLEPELTSDAGSLHAVTAGPGLPGGAPPGSGTHAPGLDGSGVLIPGWLGPSHE